MFARIRSIPSSRFSGFVRDERRIVPPRGRIPRTESIVRSIQSPSIGPRQPCRKPTISWPWPSTPLRTIARIAAFSPGQSPPPVRTPKRTRATLAAAARARLQSRALPRTLTAVLSLALLAGCGGDGGDERSEPRDADTLVVYSSLPRTGGSADVGDAVAAGQRLALADAGGRVGPLPASKLVELDSAEPDERDWDPDRVGRERRARGRRPGRDRLPRRARARRVRGLAAGHERGVDPPGLADRRADEPDAAAVGPGRRARALLPRRTRATSSGSCRRTRRRPGRSSRSRAGPARAGSRWCTTAGSSAGSSRAASSRPRSTRGSR